MYKNMHLQLWDVSANIGLHENLKGIFTKDAAADGRHHNLQKHFKITTD